MWPTYPMLYRVSSAHEEGGERVYAVNTECFLGDDDGNVRALRAHEVEQRIIDGRMTFEKIDGTDFELPCELVLLAMGFVGPQREGLLEQLGVELNERGNVARDDQFRTNLPNVFASGWHLHQSLVSRANGENAFMASDKGEALSPFAKHYLAGLLEHARAHHRAQ